MKKIKILVDAHVFDYSYQGTTTYIRGLYNSFVKFEEFDITLCGCDILNLKKNFPSEKFKYIQLKSKNKVKRILFELPEIIQRESFDYAHFQYIVPPIKKCRYINTIHDLLFMDFKEYFPWYYRFVRTKLFRYSVFKSDLVLTVSEYSKKDIGDKFQTSKDKIFITPNAVNKSIFSKVKIKEKYGLRNYIHYVSRFEPRKNQIGLLKAYIDLGLYKEGFDLVFIGRFNEGIEKKAYQNVVNSIPENIKNRIYFFNDISENELIAFYKESSCFVYPSFAEGFGIPPLEAAVYGSKVLCSDKTAMSDFKFLKYLFNPENQEEFNSKLKQILTDIDYPYQQIQQNIQEKFNWDNISFFFRDIIINDSKR